MKTHVITGIFFILLATSCKKQGELIQEPSRQADIQRMLDVQKRLTSNSQPTLWDIFNQKLTADERQALEFLYAYMPLSDLADYQPSFFLANVRQSLKARKEMAWSSKVPEDVILHFVMPLRVNNENLDSFRLVMYDEIKERIKGLDMADAALEINHWCHEKVTYRGTDSRTSSPLSTIKKSFGRCGEESTFTVSAMRTAGIPARQVYTPRWAHIDDNHAWVEVWIYGKWYYLGACEPEPELNMGWFSEPSRRAMLVHTRVYGRYFGNEEVITAADRYSELNLTSNYAPVKTVTVLVRQPNGSPADSARIEFKLYNYAEYYPIATKYTNEQGITQLATGLGDLLIWASKDGVFDYQKLSLPETDTVILLLNKTSLQQHFEVYDIVPPHGIKVDDKVSSEKRTENDRRLVREDSLRNAYMKSFKDSAWSADLALRLNLNRDTVWEFMAKSYGNWQEIANYLEKNHKNHPTDLLALAIQLSDKDYSDVPEVILTDHLKETRNIKSVGREEFERYILSPRIDLENLSPWRSFLRNNMGQMEQDVQKDISILIRWINENIHVDEQANQHSRAPLTPIGVYNIRLADVNSRNIFFVAVCRTFGIAARLNAATRNPEYFMNHLWLKATFDKATVDKAVQGYLQLKQADNPVIPQYYVHFTIGLLQDGHYKTLEFEEGLKVTDFPAPLTLDTGQYVLITGNRMEEGSVLSSMTYFGIEAGKLTKLPVVLRKNSGVLKSFGKLELDKLMIKTTNQPELLSLSTLARGKSIIVVLLDPGLEPSIHVLSDLGHYADHFNQRDNQFVFVTSAEKSKSSNIINSYTLPSNHLSGIDFNDNILAAANVLYGPGLKEKLPLVLLCDSQGKVKLFSAGYKIGIGEQLVKSLH